LAFLFALLPGKIRSSTRWNIPLVVLMAQLFRTSRSTSKDYSSGTPAVGNENEKKFDKVYEKEKTYRFNSAGLAKLLKSNDEKSCVDGMADLAPYK